ncbi:MAG: hypothetical protein IPM99_06010 [Rubrivivax sp.]|nr:hypothetical protein [Rubrivivax sp.]
MPKMLTAGPRAASPWQAFARRVLFDYPALARAAWLAITAAGATALGWSAWHLVSMPETAVWPLALALGLVALASSLSVKLPRPSHSAEHRRRLRLRGARHPGPRRPCSRPASTRWLALAHHPAVEQPPGHPGRVDGRDGGLRVGLRDGPVRAGPARAWCGVGNGGGAGWWRWCPLRSSPLP